eukprot:COSAG04_NODE_30047_length_265_cov_0.620482_1_plen_82_part_01
MDGLKHLQTFMVDALLVETRLEYEVVVRFANSLRSRDATFSELASRAINVPESSLESAGIVDNALSSLDRRARVLFWKAEVF